MKKIYSLLLILCFILLKLPVKALTIGEQSRIDGVMCKFETGADGDVVSIVSSSITSPGYTDIKCVKEGVVKLNCITLNSMGAKAGDAPHTINCYKENNDNGTSQENCTSDSNTPCFPGNCTSNNESILAKTGSGTNYTQFKCVGNGQTSVKCNGQNIPFKCSIKGSNQGGEPTIDVTPSEPNSEVLKGFCDVNKNPGVMRAFKAGGVALNILKIMIPILLIILGSIDFAQAVISSDEKQISKSLMKLAQRVIAGIVIFLVPTLIKYIFNLVDSSATNRYKTCYECLLDVSECPEIPKIGG